ncbi:MAG: translation initiation factor [Planctomycetota bacterium]
MRDERLVYDTTRGGQQPKPRKGPKAKPVDPSSTTLRLKLDTHGRKGKVVTVLSDLPHNPTYFKPILKQLKAKIGAGGALKQDRFELQGDHREAVRELFEGLGFTIRG